MDYPAARRSEVIDRYHGTPVADPYRWLEDLDSPEVAAWIAAQNAVTQSHLASLPLRARLRARLTELWDYPRTSLPVVEAGTLFYARNTGLQRQAAIHARRGWAAPPRLVLDPNALSPDGSLSLSQFSPSPDARHLAYAVASGGADWETVRVLDVQAGRDLGDELKWVRFSGLSWTADARGFFYSRYPAPPAHKALEAALANQAIYYHRLGTAQADDALIHARPDRPSWVVSGQVTEDGRYLLVTSSEGADNRNRLYAADLGDPRSPDVGAPIMPIVETGDAEYAPLGTLGSWLFLRSDKNAPNRAIVAVDLADPRAGVWRTVVPEGRHPIESAALVGGRVIVHDLVDVQSRVRWFASDGPASGDIDLPGIGTVSALGGRADEADLWLEFTTPLAPATVYRCDLAAGTRTAFEPAAPPIDAARYETRACFAVSADGTRIPYFVTARKGLPRDGRTPAVLYAYGGFSISLLPAYRPDVPAWLELGGAWVTANLRGGGEYGEAWHAAGQLDGKPRVFDDFIAVAEHLVAEGVTSPDRLGMMGGSNGGLLVGAVMARRPDLFAVALPAVGVMDMLRYDRFTGGALWATEYGTAADPAAFAVLRSYSPLHNLREGTCYPATLVTTADHDDRVVPSHSCKFTAALQAAQGCARPTLLRVEARASHGYRPTDRLIAERADVWAFAAAHLGAGA